MIWINGVAGSGKTTLAGSYIKDRGLLCLWYRIDPEDNDACITAAKNIATSDKAKQIYEKYDYNKTHTAKAMGISINTLKKYLI